jgi:hypothetical protein
VAAFIHTRQKRQTKSLNDNPLVLHAIAVHLSYNIIKH